MIPIRNNYEYSAKLLRVVDADTYDLEVDLGFSVRINHRFRLKGIDCPDTWRPKTDAEAEHGRRATEFVESFLKDKELTVASFKLGIYGRYECVLHAGGMSLAEELKTNGFEKKENYELEL